jgi:hypothetical protein
VNQLTRALLLGTTMLLAPSLAQASPLGIDATLPAEPQLHLDLTGLFTYGIGNGSALGAWLEVGGYLPVWRTARATGAVDFGMMFQYQNEPMALQPWINPNDGVSVSEQRWQLALTGGHSFYLLPSRNLKFSLFAFAGWTHWKSAGTVAIPEYQLNQSGSREYSGFLLGAGFKLGYSVHRRVSLQLQAGGPFPVTEDLIRSLFHVGLGVVVHLK